ncbi:MAG: NAD(P)/FAD-dependent oxidoreductase, partial [Promethearchaeia archaeon]
LTRDLIVVGGGPAGASCARRAAQEGLDVLLLEKDEHPRRKACGGGFRAGLPDLLDFDISSAIDRESSGSHLFSPSRTKVVCTKDEITGYTVKREIFDKLLLDKAIGAGAEVQQNVEVVDIIEATNQVEAYTQDGDRFTGKYLVGADGVNSKVARTSGIMKRWEQEAIGLCMEAPIPMDDGEIERITLAPYESGRICIQIYFGGLEHGYAWCFPKRGEISLGMGCLMPFAKDLKDAWSEFVCEFEDMYSVDLDLSEETAWRVPLAGPIENTISNRIMLVGDAAGFVSPATGEGIYYAIDTGHIAAEVVAGTLKGNLDGTREYQRRWKEGIGKDMDAANFLANLLFNSEENMERVIQMASRDEVMCSHMTDLIGGLRSYTDLRKSLMWRVLSRHALTGLKMLF